MLPDRVRRWCADALGQDVLGAEWITGGFTDAIWRISVPSGPAILRWLDTGHPYAADALQWVVREALGCRLTRGTAVPAPVLIASDTDGGATGGWANLTTFLPGRIRLDRLGPTPTLRAVDPTRARGAGVVAPAAPVGGGRRPVQRTFPGDGRAPDPP